MSTVNKQILEYAELNNQVEELQTEIAVLTAQKKAMESRMLEIKTVLKNQMIGAGMKKALIEGWKLNLSNSTSTVIEAEDKLPEAYWKIERNPNIMQIKEAFKAGVQVPGAKLVTNQNLSLKEA